MAKPPIEFRPDARRKMATKQPAITPEAAELARIRKRDAERQRRFRERQKAKK